VRISARVSNSAGAHEASVRTADAAQSLRVAAKAAPARGSAVNGGEFLMLALATCYCNALFREAARLGISLDAVEVEASAEFDGIGLSARDVRYRARVSSDASAAEIERLLRETDAVAEIHNTVRAAIGVERIDWEESA
jgi:organic hydroperoxide reductase OsmC/OhrA